MQRMVKVFVLSAVLLGGQVAGKQTNSDLIICSAKPIFFAFSGGYGAIVCCAKAVKNFEQAETLEFKLYACLMAAASVGCGFLCLKNGYQSCCELKKSNVPYVSALCAKLGKLFFN